MGQVELARAPEKLGSILGSCVAICLYSQEAKTGIMAHVVMPNSQGAVSVPGKSVDTAVPYLLQLMAEAGVPQRQLVARIAGGASMFKMSQSTIQIGQANIHATTDLLAANRIPIVGRDLGGDKGRRIQFDMTTGQVKVEIIGSEPVVI
ncbi:MAG: chemotaxis protein CheD [Pirellulaceae bacterium]